MSAPGQNPQDSKAALARFGNVPFQLRVRAARGSAGVHTILTLEPGALLPLETAPNAPVDLVQGGVVLARGEIIVVGGALKLRVTEILS